jgi:hypothetical protein
MIRMGDYCYDNAAMELFWSTIKHELVYRCSWITCDPATTAIFDYIEGVYNAFALARLPAIKVLTTTNPTSSNHNNPRSTRVRFIEGKHKTTFGADDGLIWQHFVPPVLQELAF